MSRYDDNLPPNCSPRDIPGFDRYISEAPLEDIEYFSGISNELPLPSALAWKALKAARLKEGR